MSEIVVCEMFVCVVIFIIVGFNVFFMINVIVGCYVFIVYDLKCLI